jgi:hypothetical protein
MNPTSTSPAPIDQTQANEMFSRLRAQQNLPVAILAGSGAAIAGGILWAVVTVVTDFQIGWMAVGVGFAVGYAVRLGKGLDKSFGILGAALALAGCLLGNFFALIGFVSKQEHLGLFQTLSAIDFTKIPELMISASSPMDLVFYAIAVYEGYRFSFRRITQEDLNAVKAG